MLTSELNSLVSHSGQIPAGVISTIVKIINLTAIVCHLGSPFSVFFQKIKTINYSHMTHFIRFYWSYNTEVVRFDEAASSAKTITNPGRVITIF